VAPNGEKSLRIRVLVLAELMNVTDRRTPHDGIYAAFMHIIARQKRSSAVDFLTSRYFFGREEGQRSNIKAAKTPKSFFWP